jgi:predicted DNA binding CopG/RHH family protein
MKIERPTGMTDVEKAAWMESEEGRRFLDQAEWKPARFVLAHPEFISVTMRLPADLRDRIRRLASDRAMGYQTLARQWLLERCAEEEAKEQRQAARRKPTKPRRKKPVPMNHAAG